MGDVQGRTQRRGTRWPVAVTAALAGTFLLALGGLAWACTPQASIWLDPDSGRAGSEAVVHGRDFHKGPVEIRWGDLTGPVIGRAMGPRFATAVTVPTDADPDTYTVMGLAVGTSYRASAAFTVRAAETAPSGSSSDGGPDSTDEPSGSNSTTTDGGEGSSTSGDGSTSATVSGGSGDGDGSSDGSTTTTTTPEQESSQGQEATSPEQGSRQTDQAGQTTQTTADTGAGQPAPDTSSSEAAATDDQPAGPTTTSQQTDDAAPAGASSSGQEQGSSAASDPAATSEDAARSRVAAETLTRPARQAQPGAGPATAPHRAAASDLWSGFSADGPRASLAPALGDQAVPGTGTSPQPLTAGLVLLGAGLLILTGGFGTAAARRRRLRRTGGGASPRS